jgi:hypothetical protein
MFGISDALPCGFPALPCTVEDVVGFVLGRELETGDKLVGAAGLLAFLLRAMLSTVPSKIRIFPSRSHLTSLPFVKSEPKIFSFASTVCAMEPLSRSAMVASISTVSLIVKIKLFNYVS